MNSKKISIKIVNQSPHTLPEYATDDAAGMDLRASIAESVTLQPLQRSLVPTGLFIELPRGFEAQIRPRSGLAIKNGITCLNTPGTIDSDYRGEIKVILINLSQDPYTIENGDRIAQMVFNEVVKGSWTISTEISNTNRGVEVSDTQVKNKL